MNFKARKESRTKLYFSSHYKNKLVLCSSCNGSGYYDHNGSPKCGACEGTGKVRKR